MYTHTSPSPSDRQSFRVEGRTRVRRPDVLDPSFRDPAGIGGRSFPSEEKSTDPVEPCRLETTGSLRDVRRCLGPCRQKASKG